MIMKTNLLYLFLVTALLFGACSKDNDEPTPIRYKITASLLKPAASDKTSVVTDINGYRELFDDEASIEKCDIDFSTKNLIVAQGTSSCGIASITSRIENTDNEWTLTIEIQENVASVMESWCVAYVVPKTGPTTVSTYVLYQNPSN